MRLVPPFMLERHFPAVIGNPLRNTEEMVCCRRKASQSALNISGIMLDYGFSVK